MLLHFNTLLCCCPVPSIPRNLECYTIFAGIYVGFGSFLAFTVGANLQEMAATNPGLQKFLYGAIGLPAGLVMVCMHEQKIGIA